MAARFRQSETNLYCTLISWLKCARLDTRSWAGGCCISPLLSYLLLWPFHGLQGWGFGKYTLATAVIATLSHPSLKGPLFPCRKLNPLHFIQTVTP